MLLFQPKATNESSKLRKTFKVLVYGGAGLDLISVRVVCECKIMSETLEACILSDETNKLKL